MARAEQAVGGLYDVMIGVPDLIAGIQYWEQFGFRVAQSGSLDAAQAGRLYGHKSAMRSVRMGHQEADHGLIRLVQWENSAGDGIGMHGFRTEGNRWTAQLVRSTMTLANHAVVGMKAGMPVKLIDPIYAVIHPTGAPAPRPFLDPVLGVREMTIVQPLSRQVLFERFGYENPVYGKVNEGAPLKASQVTHFGMVVKSDDHRVLDFYDRTLGLFRSADYHVPYEETVGSRIMFEIPEGEEHWLIDFDDPRSGEAADYSMRRSGRLKILRFPAGAQMPDLRGAVRPGALGLSAYSWRMGDLAAMRARVIEAGATDVTEIAKDEFGRDALSLRSPDGYFWTLLQA